jgi:hypothetical protein
MKQTYHGTDERVFPTLGLTVKPGDVIDAPEGFSHPDFTVGGAAKPAVPTPTPIKQSAASDTKAGE